MTRIIPGEKITAHTATFPARSYWYRHNKVEIDGKVLDGFIQYCHRANRVEVITCYKDACVTGTNIEWLTRMNGITEVK